MFDQLYWSKQQFALGELQRSFFALLAFCYLIMSHKKRNTDLYHSIGYEANQQHLSKTQKPKDREVPGPQAGLGGEEGSRICGQAGPELLGGETFIN